MIVFTGGGSGGHSVVAMTLIDYFRSQGEFDIQFIGSENGLERELCQKNNIPYHAISTGKLRRYLSVENFIDFFKVGIGIIQCALLFLKKLRNAKIVFSTGGFVSVAPCLVARIFGKKVFLHEQTTRIGLANKIISKFADQVFISFGQSFEFLPRNKTILSGYPIRSQFDEEKLDVSVKGLKLNELNKPLIFITGGGNGSKLINELIDKFIDQLKTKYIVFHQVGKNSIDEYIEKENESYKVFSFINEELIPIIQRADVIITRSGAGSVSEMIYLNKKTIFIPLKIAQRNEQYHNAMEASKTIDAVVITEDEVAGVDLLGEIKKLESLNSSKHSGQKRRKAQEIIFESVSAWL